tara:strand:- start:402 stop:842 length:441 start_codon:yes stop_codon:yes gene_type:complete
MNKCIRDYVRAIPGELKTPKEFMKQPLHDNKLLQKQAYRNRLPKQILSHVKTGWRFPTDEIIVGDKFNPAPNNGLLKDYIREVLKDKELQDLFEYNDDDIENQFLNNTEFQDKSQKNKKSIGLYAQKELFIILNFAVWKKVYKVQI